MPDMLGHSPFKKEKEIYFNFITGRDCLRKKMMTVVNHR
jgi:hypothetical protein